MKSKIKLTQSLNQFISWVGKQDPFFLLPISIILITAILITMTYSIFYKTLSPKIPLFYSLAWGEAQLATKQQFLILPSALILIGLINSAIAWNLHPSQHVLKRTLMSSCIFIDLILFVAAIKIMSIYI